MSIVRQVTVSGQLAYHLDTCRHVKQRAVPVPDSEMVEVMRLCAQRERQVRFDDRYLTLWPCSTCKPWEAPPRPWPPENR